MNILQYVKKHKRLASETKQAEEQEYLRKQSKEDAFMARIVAAIKSSSLKDLNKTKKLLITWDEKRGIFGEIATIEKKITFGRGYKPQWEYLGTVCVRVEPSEFCGSDESPSVTLYSTRLMFRKIVSDGEAYVDVPVHDYPADAFKKAIDKFERDMAKCIYENKWL